MLGIDTKSLNVKRQDPEVAKWVEVLKEKYAGLKLIVARDKLDYIKGVRQKMLAFERFLNLYPEYQGKVIFHHPCCGTFFSLLYDPLLFSTRE